MTKSLTADERECLLARMAGLLNQACSQRRTLTYLQLADALAIEPPLRIHKTTRLLETLLKRDAEAGRPPRAALVVSRAGGGRPAPGFFERARRLGLFDGADPDRFHDDLLTALWPVPGVVGDGDDGRRTSAAAPGSGSFSDEG